MSIEQKTTYGSDDATKYILEGILEAADIIGATLGPKGKNIVVRNGDHLTIINDGVSIAKEIVLDNDLKNMGAKMVKEVALKTNLLAGDGTTTASVLAAAILKKAFQIIKERPELNVVELKDYLIEIARNVVKNLEQKKSLISTDLKIRKKQIIDIASVSCNGNKELSEIICNAFEKVNFDGYVSVKEGQNHFDELKILSGFKHDTGFLHFALTNNKQKKAAIMKNALIFVCNEEISHPDKIVNILEALGEHPRQLVIFAKDINGQALATLLENRIEGFDVTAVRIPGPEFEKELYAEDIACYTGATVVKEDGLVRFDNLDLNYFGEVDEIEVYKENFFLKKKDLDKERINARIIEIQAEITDKKEDNYFTDLHKIRLSKLTNGYAIIYAGGYNDIEMAEKKLRIEDAINAVTGALTGGFLPGGGLALLRESHELYMQAPKNETYDLALNIMSEALVSPFAQMLKNAGQNEEKIKTIISVLKENNFSEGIDIKTGNMCNLIEKGIIDPFEVTKNALLNAVSIASVVATIGGALNLDKK